MSNATMSVLEQLARADNQAACAEHNVAYCIGVNEFLLTADEVHARLALAQKEIADVREALRLAREVVGSPDLHGLRDHYASQISRWEAHSLPKTRGLLAVLNALIGAKKS